MSFITHINIIILINNYQIRKMNIKLNKNEDGMVSQINNNSQNLTFYFL
jgi:hypothetical protein